MNRNRCLQLLCLPLMLVSVILICFEHNLSYQSISTKNNKTVSYNGLQKNNDDLLIKKQDVFNTDNFTYKSLSFLVLPYCFETWWCRLLLLVCIVYFISLRLKANKQDITMEIMLTEQKSKALRAQVNSHFLQNTFEFLAHQMDTSSKEKAIDTMHQISSYLRQVLYHSDETVLSLEDEIDFIKEYLQVQQLLVITPFKFDIDIMEDVDLYDIQVPSMLIQPIVENALKYGLNPNKDGNLIRISITCDKHYAHCIVSDNGNGKSTLPKQASHKSKGFQLTLDRMRLLYKDMRYKPSIHKSINKYGGWDVLVDIPLR